MNIFSGQRIISILMAVVCFGLLLASPVLLSGCLGGGSSSEEEKPKEKIDVLQVDQRTQLGDKHADGQFVIVKFAVKNLTTDTLQLKPEDFVLENITQDEKDKYQIPLEKSMTWAFGKEYGTEIQDRMLDFTPVNVNPKMEVERYVSFTLPTDADLSKFQLTFKPGKLSVPLQGDKVQINDHRNDEPQQSGQ